jgi:single-strand DNA-binding protein
MAEGFNRVTLLGNLGADPELKVTQGGLSVLKLRLATSERFKDKAGVWQDRTEWHSVVIWGKRAEGLHKILGKGSSILVEGSLRTSSYEDREGVKRSKTEVHALNVVLAGSRGGSRQPAAPQPDDDAYSASPPPAAVRAVAETPQREDNDNAGAAPDPFPGDDDLPF